MPVKKTMDKPIYYTEIQIKLDKILISQTKLWEIVGKLDNDILAINEIIAHLLLEYKAIRSFEKDFIKAYSKDQAEPKYKPKFYY